MSRFHAAIADARLPRLAPGLMIAVITAIAGIASDAPAQDSAAVRFFESKIRPVLIDRCYKCHSAESETVQGGLILDHRAALLSGGDSGPAIIPGKPDESLLLQALRYESLEMPPDRQLPRDVIENFRAWISMGAPDPREADSGQPGSRSAEQTATSHYESATQHWSFQPSIRPVPPTVQDRSWPLDAIDTFIVDRLEENGLRPAFDATPVDLIRRLYIDLWGLPPSPSELENWARRISKSGEGAQCLEISVQDHDSTMDDRWNERGLAELVDALLHSPRFGQRWGRHWLDLARYADSTGGGASNVLPDAWKYRDYVVASFNKDKPYDQFVREQIAGDLLAWTDIEDRAENLVATGFLVMGPRSYITDDATTFQMDGIDEQLDAVGRVFLGMTIGCARCHDHKFDPIPATDYYALAGIFESTQTARQISGSKNYTWHTVADPREDPDGSRLAEHEHKTAEYRMLSKQVAALQRAIESVRGGGRLPAGQRSMSKPSWIASREKQLAEMRVRLQEARAAVPDKPSTFMGVCCAAKPISTRLRIRGNPHRQGPAVPRGLLTLVSHQMPGRFVRPSMPAVQSGRLQLADWIVARENPLTMRVFVNRVWHHLFGRGIVTTVDNFGTTGVPPSHPELLDFLVSKFVANEYSVKELIRMIVLTRSYRVGTVQRNADGEQLRQTDPENSLFGRRLRRSLDAETIRDSILAVSGRLDTCSGGPSFTQKISKEYAHVFQSERRSIYVPRFRNHQLELFQVFDAANPALVVGRRDQTILPTQALFWFNHPFVVQYSRKSAERLLSHPDTSVPDRIRQLYLATLGRVPTEEETELAITFLDGLLFNSDITTVEAWSAFQQVLFECVDFRYAK